MSSENLILYKKIMGVDFALPGEDSDTKWKG